MTPHLTGSPPVPRPVPFGGSRSTGSRFPSLWEPEPVRPSPASDSPTTIRSHERTHPMTEHNNQQQTAQCPLPNCNADVYLSVSHNFIVEETLTPVSDLEPRHAITDEWEVVCTEGHRLDYGSPETDGRSAVLGLRSALSLGGLR